MAAQSVFAETGDDSIMNADGTPKPTDAPAIEYGTTKPVLNIDPRATDGFEKGHGPIKPLPDGRIPPHIHIWDAKTLACKRCGVMEEYARNEAKYPIDPRTMTGNGRTDPQGIFTATPVHHVAPCPYCQNPACNSIHKICLVCQKVDCGNVSHQNDGIPGKMERRSMPPDAPPIFGRDKPRIVDIVKCRGCGKYPDCECKSNPIPPMDPIPCPTEGTKARREHEKMMDTIKGHAPPCNCNRCIAWRKPCDVCGVVRCCDPRHTETVDSIYRRGKAIVMSTEMVYKCHCWACRNHTGWWVITLYVMFMLAYITAVILTWK